MLEIWPLLGVLATTFVSPFAGAVSPIALPLPQDFDTRAYQQAQLATPFSTDPGQGITGQVAAEQDRQENPDLKVFINNTQTCVRQGEELAYRVVARNYGLGNAQQVTLQMRYPTALLFLDSDPKPTIATDQLQQASALKWFAPNIPHGTLPNGGVDAYADFSVIFNVTEPTESVTVEVVAYYTDIDGQPYQTLTRHTINGACEQPVLEATITEPTGEPSTLSPCNLSGDGQDFPQTWTLHKGEGTWHNVETKVELPAGVTFVSADEQPQSVSADGRTIIWFNRTINSGQKRWPLVLRFAPGVRSFTSRAIVTFAITPNPGDPRGEVRGIFGCSDPQPPEPPIPPSPTDAKAAIVCDPAEIGCVETYRSLALGERYTTAQPPNPNNPRQSACPPGEPMTAAGTCNPGLGIRFAEAIADITPGECRVIEDDVIASPDFQDALNRRGDPAAPFMRPLYDSGQDFRRLAAQYQILNTQHFTHVQQELAKAHAQNWQEFSTLLQQYREGEITIEELLEQFDQHTSSWIARVNALQGGFQTQYDALQEQKKTLYEPVAEKAVVNAERSLTLACGPPKSDGGLEALLLGIQAASGTVQGIISQALAATAQCADSIDNDGDGRIDSVDAGCHKFNDPRQMYSPNDDDESGEGACADGKDDPADADTLADEDDPGCHLDNNPFRPYSPNDNTEDGEDACADGIDNDGDGQIDSVDAGCHKFNDPRQMYSPNDDDESGEGACADGIDNDGDGRTDAADAGCHLNNDPRQPWALNDATEAGETECADGKDNGDPDDLSDAADPGCHLDDDIRKAYTPLAISEGGEVECSDGIDNGDLDELADADDAGCHISDDPRQGYAPHEASEDGEPACVDGVDNDLDGRTDGADAGCHLDNDPRKAHAYDDPSEDGESECADGKDNADPDGLSDAADPGCHLDDDIRKAYTPLAISEGGEVECSDGIDNGDPDTLADADDAGCHISDDPRQGYAPHEASEGGEPACVDGVDNDQDGRSDSADAGCHLDNDPRKAWAYDDPSEDGEAACTDGKDNEGDGRSDVDDTGCHLDDDPRKAYTPLDVDESGEAACTDGTDNDGDTRKDAEDAGCHLDDDLDKPYTPLDVDEGSDPITECNDGIDSPHDADTLSDADDAGCHLNNDPHQRYRPNDNNEDGESACVDGVDNDGDGRHDEQDAGCHLNNDPRKAWVRTDNNEDGESQCVDGKDNDGDKRIDGLDAGCHKFNDPRQPYSPNDNNEDGEPQCVDGKDNDGDTVADAADPGCHVGDKLHRRYVPMDNDEGNPAPPPRAPGTTVQRQLNEAFDEAKADYELTQQDSIAEYRRLLQEIRQLITNRINASECSDGVDSPHDADTLSDADDAGCHLSNDPTQPYVPHDNNEGGEPACVDGIDNDGDGRHDEQDAGCHLHNDPAQPWAHYDDQEAGEAMCADGKDNDNDSREDAEDAGCHLDNDLNKPYTPGDVNEASESAQLPTWLQWPRINTAQAAQADPLANFPDNIPGVLSGIEALFLPYALQQSEDGRIIEDLRVNEWEKALDTPKTLATTCERENTFTPPVATTWCESGSSPSLIIKEAPVPDKIQTIKPPPPINDGEQAIINEAAVTGNVCGGGPGDPYWTFNCACHCGQLIPCPTRNNELVLCEQYVTQCLADTNYELLRHDINITSALECSWEKDDHIYPKKR